MNARAWDEMKMNTSAHLEKLIADKHLTAVGRLKDQVNESYGDAQSALANCPCGGRSPSLGRSHCECAPVSRSEQRGISAIALWHHDCIEEFENSLLRDFAANMRNHNTILQTSQVRRATVRIAVIESDPLRFVGFRALLSSEPDFELRSFSLTEIGTHQDVDVVLLGRHPGKRVIDVLTTIKALCRGLDVIVTGCNLDDAAILSAIAAGAKGCIDEAASVGEFVRAIRIVMAGSVWAPRRVLAMFVEQAYLSSGHGVSIGQRPFTMREKEVLGMLAAGCTNKDIAVPLGIAVRTVKGHVAKLLQKVGVPNRVMLSVHAIAHSLVAVEN